MSTKWKEFYQFESLLLIDHEETTDLIQRIRRSYEAHPDLYVFTSAIRQLNRFKEPRVLWGISFRKSPVYMIFDRENPELSPVVVKMIKKQFTATYIDLGNDQVD